MNENATIPTMCSSHIQLEVYDHNLSILIKNGFSADPDDSFRVVLSWPCAKLLNELLSDQIIAHEKLFEKGE